MKRELTLIAALWAIPLVFGCAATGAGPGQDASKQSTPEKEPAKAEPVRQVMVRTQIEARGVKDPLVLEAMRSVPRHEFVPTQMREYAYADRPLPIGERQTISQPYIVALMTELAQVKKDDRVLEVGTGSGYQAAVLAEIGARVHTIEIIPSLAARARKTLEAVGYDGIEYRVGDGYGGWPEAAPFDSIIVTAAPGHVPQPLVDQLKMGGRLVIPVGKAFQQLVVITATPEGPSRKEIIPVRFVPMTGKAQRVEERP